MISTLFRTCDRAAILRGRLGHKPALASALAEWALVEDRRCGDADGPLGFAHETVSFESPIGANLE